MKIIFTILTSLMLLFTFTSIAQTVELTPFAGYTFQSTKNMSGGRFRVNDGFTYGGALTIAASAYNSIEVSYYRYETDLNVSGYTGAANFSTPVAVNYMFVGGQRLFPASDMVTAFTGLNLGAGWMSSTDGSYSTITKFAMGVNAGVKIMASDRIGVRLQTNFNFPITSYGGSYYWGTGGSGVAVNGYLPMWSFGFTGGLIFKLN